MLRKKEGKKEMNRILFCEVEPAEHVRYQQAFAQDTLLFSADPITVLTAEQKKLYAAVEVLSVFVCSRITKEVIDCLPALRLIVTRSTGYDHIDCAAAQERGIRVCSLPTYAAVTVAEYTMALLLALSRKICMANYYERCEKACSNAHLRGFDLQGKTLGIVGMGNIGKEVAKRAHGFGMQLCAFDLSVDQDFARTWNVHYLALNDLYAQADVISLHVPLNKHTMHLINNDTLQCIKRGAYLINTARGAIVDPRALVNALDEGIIAGAALDVLQEECSLCATLHTAAPQQMQSEIADANNYLINHERVIVTPHNAYNSEQSYERMINATIKTIQNWKKNLIENAVV